MPTSLLAASLLSASLLTASVLLALFPVSVQAAAPESVTVTAADGVKVFGEFWPAAEAKAALILAFHQAGSSHAEYAPLAPRLNAAGFHMRGVHGSATLRADRNAAGAEENWAAVLAFLAKFKVSR
jgi:alpha-beta hydrolase superfamily lysophospholipase